MENEVDVVRVTKVDVPNPTAKFTDNIKIDVEFESTSELKNDLEWKLIYAGGVEEKDDQILDTICVGPIKEGTSKFTFDCSPPDATKISHDNLIGATILLLCGFYNDKEFVRVGYYVNNEYENDEMNKNLPETHDVEKIQRDILSTKPRITQFSNDWDN